MPDNIISDIIAELSPELTNQNHPNNIRHLIMHKASSMGLSLYSDTVEESGFVLKTYCFVPDDEIILEDILFERKGIIDDSADAIQVIANIQTKSAYEHLVIVDAKAANNARLKLLRHSNFQDCEYELASKLRCCHSSAMYYFKLTDNPAECVIPVVMRAITVKSYANFIDKPAALALIQHIFEILLSGELTTAWDIKDILTNIHTLTFVDVHNSSDIIHKFGSIHTCLAEFEERGLQIFKDGDFNDA